MIEVRHFWRDDDAVVEDQIFPVKTVRVDRFGDKLRLFLKESDTVHISGLNQEMIDHAVAAGEMYAAFRVTDAHPGRVSAIGRAADWYDGPCTAGPIFKFNKT